ncbi:hypothetical protein [Pseudomonas sp. DSP3-2-2]|uniref:hypothetical protein n=1 Tax=unclassified Pseudomonas TaxID=196821 RepID=UPI003CF57C90
MTAIMAALKSALKYAAAALGGAVILGSSTAIQERFVPTMKAAMYIFEDLAFSMQKDQMVAIDLRFFITTKDSEATSENVSANLVSSDCRSNGNVLVENIGTGISEYQTHAVLTVACRRSGRITISLTPQNGSPIEVFNGKVRRDSEEKVSFAGNPGSYSAGILSMKDLGFEASPWDAIPSCQTNTCCASRHPLAVSRDLKH